MIDSKSMGNAQNGDNSKCKYFEMVQTIVCGQRESNEIATINNLMVLFTASFPPVRLSIALMLFATTFVSYIVRVNLSISILGMVRIENQTEDVKYDLPDVSWAIENRAHCTAILKSWVIALHSISVRSTIQLVKFATKSCVERILLWFDGNSIDWRIVESIAGTSNRCWYEPWIECDRYSFRSVGSWTVIILGGFCCAILSWRFFRKFDGSSIVDANKLIWMLFFDSFSGNFGARPPNLHSKMGSHTGNGKIHMHFNRWHSRNRADMAIRCISNDTLGMGVRLLHTCHYSFTHHNLMVLHCIQFTSRTSAHHRTWTQIYWSIKRKHCFAITCM